MPSGATIGFGVIAGVIIVGGLVYWSLPPAPVEGPSKWEAREQRMVQLETELKEITKQIHAVQGQGVCDSDGQCRVVSLGALVCGFSRDYLIYSTRDAEEKKLQAHLAQFRQVHQKIVDLALTASKCGIPPRSVHCRSRRCVVGSD